MSRFAECCGVDTGSALRATSSGWRDRVAANADAFVGWTVSVIVLVVGGNVGSAQQQVSDMQTTEYLEVATRLWKPLPAMNSPRFSPAVMAVKNEIFVFGGLANGRALDTAEVLDLSTKKWTRLPNLRVPRSSPMVVFAAGGFYLLGGLNGGEIVKKLECLDISRRDQFEVLPDMNEARTQTAVAAVGGLVMVIGGLTFSLASATVEAYDVALRQWINLPPMYEGRVNPQVVPMGDKMVVLGGRGGLAMNVLTSVEIFDSATKVWYQLPHMPSPHNTPGVCSVGETLYCFGGDVSGIPSKASYKLDLAAEVPDWIEMASMDMGVSSPLVVPVGKLHFIVLGGYSLSKFRAMVQYFKTEKNTWDVWASSDAQMGVPRVGCGCVSVSVVPFWAKDAGFVRKEATVIE